MGGFFVRHQDAVGEPEGVLDAGFRDGAGSDQAAAALVERVGVEGVGIEGGAGDVEP